MNIWLGYHSPLLWVIVVDIFFVTSDYTMPKLFHLSLACANSTFWLQFKWNTISLLLKHSQQF